MHMDPMLPQAVAACLMMLVIAIALKLLKQPHVIAYLLAGIVLGPFGLAVISDAESISRLGASGVVLLLFFVGMEVDTEKLLASWRVSVFGTAIQIFLSVAITWLIGLYFNWSMERILLIGFVISLSSTAVVIKLLQDGNILSTRVGQAALGVLLAQDLAIIPMLIALGMLGSGEVDLLHISKQAGGAVLAIGLFAYIVHKKTINLPWAKWIKADHELQLFAALSVCFGLALITGWFDLSTALGAFIAGLLIGAAKETRWVHHSLEPFKVLFLALFFVSVGMLLDLHYLRDHLPQAIALTLAALLTNTFINALILKAARFSWKDSLYSGVLLAQIGEFSFVLAAVGSQVSIINADGYQLALCVISLSLLVSPMWITVGRKLLAWEPEVAIPK